MTDSGDPPPSRARTCIRRTELIVNGILFGIWNNVSTIINASTLIEEGRKLAAILSILFLFFPGVVTSLGFMVLHWLGHRRLKRLPPLNLFIIFFVLLFFYPVVPIAFCVYTLFFGGKHRELAILSKLFEGFLDDGPQFVLRLVVFVLFGIGMKKDKDDIIFTLSMVTSFGALVYFGLKFNERQTNGWTKWLLSFPMFAASVASRGFTLAVFLKETTFSDINEGSGNKEWIGGLVVVVLYILVNISTFRFCGQDWIRSVVFGLSSTLIPAGYNNDTYFYQRPSQPLWGAPVEAYADTDDHLALDDVGVLEGEAKLSHVQEEKLPKMRSAIFLVVHTVASTALLSSCAAYILATRSGSLSEPTGHALFLPQILAVVPGCFFTLARSVLLIEEPPFECCNRFGHSDRVWEIVRIGLSILFGIIAYASLIPACLTSVIWKVASLTVNLIENGVD